MEVYMRTKYLFLILAAVLAGVLHAGAQKEGANTLPNLPSGEPSGKVTYPLDAKGTVKLKYWMPLAASASQFISSYAENTAYQEIQKETGVEIEFIHPTIGQETSQLNLLIASGDLPDIIQQAALYAGGLSKGYLDGAYIDLLPYLPYWAPDYYKFINSGEIARKQTYIDNKVLAFYKMTFAKAIPYHRPILRADWLKEAGLSTSPRTLDEWETYFESIIKNHKGIAPIYIDFQSSQDQDLWMGAYDMLGSWYVVDGKIMHFRDNPRYKDFLVRMNEWYEKGYITKDFSSLNLQQVLGLFDSGEIGAYSNSVDVAYTRSRRTNIPTESAPNPRLSAGQQLHTGMANWPIDSGTSFPTAVTSSCGDIERAIKFLNFGYTEKGYLIYNYGTEGKTYAMVNGKPQFTDFMLRNPDGKTASNVSFIYKIHFAPKWCAPDTEAHPGVVSNPDALKWRLKWSEDPNVDDSYRMLPVSMTEKETDEYTRIMVDIDAYAVEMKLKFIIGAEPLSRFDDYIKRLNDMKFQRAKEIIQAAYDRLMSK
jgi:putative aldouronate transport system substrate-binding protein